MCMIDDSDGCAVRLHMRQQRARVQHRCTECGRTIEPGETYTSERTVFEGSAQSHKVCAHCAAVRDYLGETCGGWVYGCLREDISDHYYRTRSNDAEERERRLLAVGMAERWRRADGRLWPVPGQSRAAGGKGQA